MSLIRPLILSAGSLLDPAERQAVLGDIEERGPSFRALLDLTGLVLLRQVQSLGSWKTWVVTAALFVPSVTAAYSALVLGNALTTPVRSSPAYLLLEASIAIVLTWSAAFSLGVLRGPRGAIALFALLPLVLWTQAWPPHTTVGASITAIAVACLAAVIGFRGGLLHKAPSLWLGLLVIFIGAFSMWLLLPPATFPQLSWWSLSFAAIWWPVLYALAYVPLRSRIGTR